jgi:hypothetical protein
MVLENSCRLVREGGGLGHENKALWRAGLRGANRRYQIHLEQDISNRATSVPIN